MEKARRTDSCPGGRTQAVEPAPARMAYPAKRRYPAETPEQLVFNCLDHGAHPVLGGYKGPNKLDAPDREIWDARLGPLLAASDFFLAGRSRAEASADEARFYGKGGKAGRLEGLDDGPQGLAEICFAEWVLAKAEPSAGSAALAQAGLAPQAEALSYLESLSGSHLSLFEVQAVRGSRMLLADMLEAGAAPVWADFKDTGLLPLQWDIVALRLLPWQGRLHAGSGALFFERPSGADLSRALRASARRRKSPASSPAGESSLARRDLRLVESWLHEQEQGDGLEAVQTVEPEDGDLLAFEPAMDGCSVADWEAFRRAAAGWEDLVPFEDRGRGISGWMWKVPARPGRTQAEAAELIPWHEFEDEDDTLYVESCSTAFGDAAMRMLEERFGKAVRLEWRSRGDMDNFMHEPMPGNDDPEGQDDWFCEFAARANLEYAFMPLDELGGRSVARCAGLKSMRAKAVEWLKHFESAEAGASRTRTCLAPSSLTGSGTCSGSSAGLSMPGPRWSRSLETEKEAAPSRGETA